MARLFSKKRNDGYLVEDIEAMQFVQPYVMRGRNESAVYFKLTVDIDNIDRYIRQKRQEGKRITIFNIIVTALLHLVYERPLLNRFVAGRRIYQRKEPSICYVVKRTLTDDSDESVARINLTKNDNLFTVSQRMTDHINYIRERQGDKSDDKLMSFMKKFPRWLLRFIASLFFYLDFHGIMPERLHSILPMNCSIFISHIGSLGASAPIHHLYEFGNNSIFITIGKIYDLPTKADDGGVEWVKAIDMWFSVDERICDGFYFIRSVRRLERLLRRPELLEESPLRFEQDKKLQEEERAERLAKRNRERELEDIELYGHPDDYKPASRQDDAPPAEE